MVPRDGETLTEEEIRDYCAGTLPDYRLPKAFFFIDALPKNDRGKVRRDDLKAQWQRDHDAGSVAVGSRLK